MGLWRLVLAKAASWADLNGPQWSIEDVEKANAALDMKGAIEEAMMPPPPENNK